MMFFFLNTFFDPTLRGTRAEFFQKNKSCQKFLKHVSIDSVFYADSKYIILFSEKVSSPTKIAEISAKKVTQVAGHAYSEPDLAGS
jgi:hypothetical protein